MITQVLPDVFYKKSDYRQAICLIIEKKATSLILTFTKKYGIKLEETYLLKDNNNTEINDQKNSYKFGKCKIGNSQVLKTESEKEFILHDLAHLKKVKQYSNEENILLISFSEVI